MKCSREVVFVNTNHPSNRIQIVKSKQELLRLPPNSTDIYIKDTLDHYVHRLQELENICLASFVAWYNYSSKDIHRKNVIGSDYESDTDSWNDNNRSLKLIDNSGFIRKRNKSKIIRFVNYNEQTGNEKFVRENVMLFVPWRDENVVITSASELFSQHQNLIKKTRSEYVHNENIETILNEAKTRIYESDDDSNTEKRIPRSLEVFNDPSQKGDIAIDMNDNMNGMNNKNADTDVYFVSIPGLIAEENFINLVCFLNEKQRQFLLHVSHHFKTNSFPNCIW